MRTTLDIDEDALEAAKSIARAERKSLGTGVSELVRRALTARLGATETGFADEQASYEAYGWHVLPSRGGMIVTPEAIERVQEELDRQDAGPASVEAAGRPRQ
jgi:CubicO group peptidase (beta-lactamase class C family)